MVKNKVKVRYSPESDILYILIKKGKLKDTVELAEDLFMEIAEDGSIAGIEIWNARELLLKDIAEYIKTLAT
jgi:uncharacterized protein YuzE